MSVTQTITSRREMLQLLDDQIQNTQSDLLEQTQLEFGRNMLKTAVIESNIPPEDFKESETIQEVVDIESDLILAKAENNEGDGWLFADFHDNRFWMIYSLGDSNFFNTAIDELLQTEGGGLDRLWLPAGEVEEIGEMGEYEGVKMSFEADEVFSEEFLEDNLPLTDLSIDGSGRNARQLYDILKRTEEIDEYLALSRIQIRREIEGEFVRESISNDGRFTTRGGSEIQLHVSTVEQIKDRYARILGAIEENHLIGAEEYSAGARPRGAPVVIKFSKPVPDVEAFLSHVVNAQDPFRLWGHLRQVSESGYKVDGVDAHNGDKIAIEMSPEWLRLYLYDGACGNTALRLFTNIQQYYDPAAELVIADA